MVSTTKVGVYACCILGEFVVHLFNFVIGGQANDLSQACFLEGLDV